MKRSIALISTGGTIEKTYDELRGVLSNQVSVLDVMLASLELRGVDVHRVQLMNKDSLDMSPEDHTLIAEIAGQLATVHGGVVVVHGTDRLAVSGERVVELVLGTPEVVTLEINPLIVTVTGAWACDALLVISEVTT